METDEFSETMEFIKMETEEAVGPLLTSSEISSNIAKGEFFLRDCDKKSKVWNVFALIYNRNFELVQGFVCCKDCGKLLRYHNSTANLAKHRCYIVKFGYKGESSKPENSNSSSLDNTIGEIQKPVNSNVVFEQKIADVVTTGYANNILTSLFTKCFITSCRSYGILQDDNFRAIFQELIAFGARFGTNIDTCKIIPNAMAVAKNINAIYESCFARLNNEIAAAKENGFGLGCHMWTKDCSKQSYFVLTIHYLNCGKIANRLLGLQIVEDEKSSNQTISQQISHILQNYNCKLSSTLLIVTSGCSNMSDANTVPCISTSISDALAKSMVEIPEISQLVTSCMTLRHFLMSIHKDIKLEKHTSPSHWLLLYRVLELTANSWGKIEKIVKSKSSAHMENINKSHLEAVVKTLQPFKDAIESLEEDDGATLHLVLVYLHDLKKCCEAKTTECEQYSFIKTLKKLLRQYLDQIVAENITSFHKVALFLYPPANKLVPFDDIERKNIEAECMRLMRCFEVDVKINTKKEEEGQEPIVTCPVQFKKKKLFLDFVYSPSEDKDASELIKEELQIYRMTRVVDSEDFNVFNWWEQQQQHFPRLYKLSHMLLTTPATSVAAQRISASVGDLLSNQTSEFCTNGIDIDRIAFVKFNIEPDALEFKF